MQDFDEISSERRLEARKYWETQGKIHRFRSPGRFISGGLRQFYGSNGVEFRRLGLRTGQNFEDLDEICMEMSQIAAKSDECLLKCSSLGPALAAFQAGHGSFPAQTGSNSGVWG